MIYAALILVNIVTVALALWSLDRKDNRIETERGVWSDERRSLLNRIQAPREAAYQVGEIEEAQIIYMDEEREYRTTHTEDN